MTHPTPLQRLALLAALALAGCAAPHGGLSVEAPDGTVTQIKSGECFVIPSGLQVCNEEER